MNKLSSFDRNCLLKDNEAKILEAIKRGNLDKAEFTSRVSDWHLTSVIRFFETGILVENIDIVHDRQGECVPESEVISIMRELSSNLRGLATTNLQRKRLESISVPTYSSSTKVTIDAYMDASILQQAVSKVIKLHRMGMIDKVTPIVVSNVVIYIDITTNNIGQEYVRDISVIDSIENERAGTILKYLIEDELNEVYKNKCVSA